MSFLFPYQLLSLIQLRLRLGDLVQKLPCANGNKSALLTITPSFGLSGKGVTTSNFAPTKTCVLPSFVNALPSALGIAFSVLRFSCIHQSLFGRVFDLFEHTLYCVPFIWVIIKSFNSSAIV